MTQIIKTRIASVCLGGGGHPDNIEKVDTLPSIETAKAGVTYLVPVKDDTDKSLLDVFIVFDGEWINIGTINVSLWD